MKITKLIDKYADVVLHEAYGQYHVEYVGDYGFDVRYSYNTYDKAKNKFDKVVAERKELYLDY